MTRISEHEFVDLVNSPRKIDRVRALSSDASLSVWLRILRNHPQLARSVAFSRNVPSEVLNELSRDERVDVREAVASRRSLPRELAEFLARDKAGQVRMMVLRKSDLCREMVVRLTSDECPDIVAIATDKLKRIDQLRQREAGTLEGDCVKPCDRGFEPMESAELFVRLRSSTVQEEYVRSAYASATFTVWMDVAERFPEYKKWIVHNKTVESDILKELSRDIDEGIRAAVAVKSATDELTLRHLANDDSAYVRCSLAGNRRLPRDVLFLLSSDPDEEVRTKARRTIACIYRR